MRVVFMGTPDFAVPILDAIVNSSHRVAAVITQPDRPAGRGNKMTPSPVKKRAEELSMISGLISSMRYSSSPSGTLVSSTMTARRSTPTWGAARPTPPDCSNVSAMSSNS